MTTTAPPRTLRPTRRAARRTSACGPRRPAVVLHRPRCSGAGTFAGVLPPARLRLPFPATSSCPARSSVAPGPSPSRHPPRWSGRGWCRSVASGPGSTATTSWTTSAIRAHADIVPELQHLELGQWIPMSATAPSERHRIPGGGVRAQPVAAVAQTRQHLGLEADRRRRRNDPSRDPRARGLHLESPPHSTTGGRPDGARRLRDDAQNAAWHQGTGRGPGRGWRNGRHHPFGVQGGRPRPGIDCRP